jgi:hypothetical protein
VAPASEKPAAPQEPIAPPPPPAAVVPTVPAVPPPAGAPAAPTPKFTFGGLVDTYYMYNFTKVDGTNSLTMLPPGIPGATAAMFTPLGVGRAFDTNLNSMTLALAKLTMNAALDPVSLQLDLGYGSVGNIINAANGQGIPPASGTTNVPGAFLVEQAYGEIALPGNLTLDFGKFTTTAGAEVIEANKNWLYSRSLLFNAIPLLHTGVRANLKVSDMLTLQASVVNGWNNDPDLNAWKTIGLSASITASPALSAVITTYFGKEASESGATSTPGDLRWLVDLVGAYTVNANFGLNLNIDYIKAFDDIAADYQIGAALMGRFVANDHVNVAARGEYLGTHLDASSATLSQGEVTVMVGIDVGKNFELRPEVRADFAGKFGGVNVLQSGQKSSMVTGEIAALTWF